MKNDKNKIENTTIKLTMYNDYSTKSLHNSIHFNLTKQ